MKLLIIIVLVCCCAAAVVALAVAYQDNSKALFNATELLKDYEGGRTSVTMSIEYYDVVEEKVKVEFVEIMPMTCVNKDFRHPRAILSVSVSRK